MPFDILPYIPPTSILHLPSPSYVVSFFCATRDQWADKKKSRRDTLLALGGAVYTLPRGRLRPTVEANLFVFPLVQETEAVPTGWQRRARSFNANVGRPDQRYSPAAACHSLLELLRTMHRGPDQPLDPIVLLADGLPRHQPHIMWLIQQMENAVRTGEGSFKGMVQSEVTEIQETLARLQFADATCVLAHMAGISKTEARNTFDRFKGTLIDTAQEDAYQVGRGLMLALESYNALPPLEG